MFVISWVIGYCLRSGLTKSNGGRKCLRKAHDRTDNSYFSYKGISGFVWTTCKFAGRLLEFIGLSLLVCQLSNSIRCRRHTPKLCSTPNSTLLLLASSPTTLLRQNHYPIVQIIWRSDYVRSCQNVRYVA